MKNIPSRAWCLPCRTSNSFYAYTRIEESLSDPVWRFSCSLSAAGKENLKAYPGGRLPSCGTRRLLEIMRIRARSGRALHRNRLPRLMECERLLRSGLVLPRTQELVRTIDGVTIPMAEACHRQDSHQEDYCCQADSD